MKIWNILLALTVIQIVQNYQKGKMFAKVWETFSEAFICSRPFFAYVKLHAQ